MLSIGKLGASVDQLGYYEQQVAQGLEDYISGRGEAPGRWIGGGCGGVGISGQVDRDAFMRAMNGCDPHSGERLRPEHGRTKVAAFDLTFSAPKSVSVLLADRYDALTFEAKTNGRQRRVQVDGQARQRLRSYVDSVPAVPTRPDALVGVLVEADFEKRTARLRTTTEPAVQVTFDEELADQIQAALREQASFRGEVVYDAQSNIASPSGSSRSVTGLREGAFRLRSR